MRYFSTIWFQSNVKSSSNRNNTNSSLDLFDEEGNPWIFTDGIVYTFPANTSVPANSRILLAKDPATFNSEYGTPSVTVFGPYDGKLNNAGEDLELSKPGDPNLLGEIQYILVDRLKYESNNGWPIEADGGGSSLTRVNVSAYGNDVINWQAAEPTPGE